MAHTPKSRAPEKTRLSFCFWSYVCFYYICASKKAKTSFTEVGGRARSHTSHISFMRLQKNERKINFIAHQTPASGARLKWRRFSCFQNNTQKSPQFFASSPSHLVHSECLAQLLSSLEIINTGWAWCCVWDSLLFIFFLLFFSAASSKLPLRWCNDGGDGGEKSIILPLRCRRNSVEVSIEFS